MTDDDHEGKKATDEDEAEWEDALSEWESTSFSPEIAPEIPEDRPSSNSGPPAGGSRPLYRPPSVVHSTDAPAPRPTVAPPPPLFPPDESQTGVTRMARIPEELLRPPPEDDEVREPTARVLVRPRTPLLAPEARQHDPDDVTAVARLPLEPAARADGARHQQHRDGDDERPTSPVPRAPLEPTRPWADERAASTWLSAEACDRLRGRAEWLEEEARSSQDAAVRARLLLACSEIRALVGETDAAHALAAESRDAAPGFGLAQWQARTLGASSSDAHAADLDANGPEDGAPAAARLHVALLAAERLRADGDDAAADGQLRAALYAAPTDARTRILVAAGALARGELTDPALQGDAAPDPDGSAGRAWRISNALSACVRLRGGAAGSASDDASATGAILLDLRRALDRAQTAEASTVAARLADVPGLADAAAWLAASLAASTPSARTDAARWLEDLASRGDAQAARALAARAIELGDRARIAASATRDGDLSPAERVVLALLSGEPIADAVVDQVASEADMQPLVAAAAAVATPASGDTAIAVTRASRTAGRPSNRARVRLGRLLASTASLAEVPAAVAELEQDVRLGLGRAVSLDAAARAGRTEEVSRALRSWNRGDDGGAECAASLAAGLVAEHAGDTSRALEAYKAAHSADPTNEAALRAVASLEAVDLVGELKQLGDSLDQGSTAAAALVEAAARSEGSLPEPTRALLLERAHTADPDGPIAPFLAEKIARAAGDVEEVLRWIRERRARATDPMEAALDGVREALLVAPRDPSLAGQRLLEAHRARPRDVALRRLYERVASPPPEDAAAWREHQSVGARGDAQTTLLLDAANEYARAGDVEGALRCAEAAASGGGAFAEVVREEAEVAAKRVARLTERWIEAAKATEGPARREAYERLAVLDEVASDGTAGPLLWHRAIVDGWPDHLPSLRRIEHELVGGNLEDDLEPVAAAIARALRGTGAGECTAHAELAARLRSRAVDADPAGARELTELAANESDASLGAVRGLQTQARARGDDMAYLAATLRLVERSSRPPETASLLLRAGEAATRLGRSEEALALFERASREDPGDVVAWERLADARRQASDAQGAAEAYESLARCSAVAEHRLRAWYEAGRIWESDGGDLGRALVAYEAAALVDAAHEDVFDRLARIYADRKMPSELAALLERRLDGIAEPEERIALEVRRGHVLLEAGDPHSARAAFERALMERPDHAGALAAFADLCESDRDWEAAEQALVRLARLVPTADQQREVYARLGTIYAERLVNLSRAEVALREVLKRAPGNTATLEKLVDVCRRQNDAASAAQLQQELVGLARSPEEKRARVIRLAEIHEHTGHDLRRAEQTLEAARRELPSDVHVLRALVDFYARHRQTPAQNVLLDRVAADARRAIGAGRVSAAQFEVLATVFELRENGAAAKVARSMLAALEGRPAEIRGAGERALDPRLDDLLAPEAISPSTRTLLAKTGDALDAASPFDVRAFRAAPIPADSQLKRLAARYAQAAGLGGVDVLVSPKLGTACLPVTSSPPAILVGEDLVAPGANARIASFAVVRAIKLAQLKAAALSRSKPGGVAVLAAAWFKCFNPTWQPEGVDPAAVAPLAARIQAALPRQLDPDVSFIALEAAGATPDADQLGAHLRSWANRVALLALGDVAAALEAIAVAGEDADSGADSRKAAQSGAPRLAATAVATEEGRDLLAFAVTGAFADARKLAGLAGVED